MEGPQLFTPPPKGRQHSPDQAPLKTKEGSPFPSPNTQKFPRPTKSDSHLGRRITALPGIRPSEKKRAVSPHEPIQLVMMKDTIKKVDKFKKAMEKVKPYKSYMDDLQNEELRELVAKQEKALSDLVQIEEELDSQMRNTHYLEKYPAAQKMPQFEEFEQNAVYKLNQEFKKTEQMLEELLERGSRMECTDFMKVLKVKLTILRIFRERRHN